MTALELLATCKAVGVDLHARGGRLKYEAPVGALTPDLRSKLKQKKAELLALLTAPRCVTLAPTGLTLPLPVLELSWDLEERGFLITTTEAAALSVEPRNALTPRDKANLERWEGHLSALCDFCDGLAAT